MGSFDSGGSVASSSGRDSSRRGRAAPRGALSGPVAAPSAPLQQLQIPMMWDGAANPLAPESHELPVHDPDPDPDSSDLLHAVVKNTFLEAVEKKTQSLPRCASDSNISYSSRSAASGEALPYYLPSLWSEDPSLSKPASESGTSQQGTGLQCSFPVVGYPPDLSSADDKRSTGGPRVSTDAERPEPGPVGTSEDPQVLPGEVGEGHDEGTTIPLDLIPLNERGEMTSVGSIGHRTNDCTPCIFWFKNCCSKGIHCGYCHFVHKGQRNKRIRPSKRTRQLMRDPGRSAGSMDPDTIPAV